MWREWIAKSTATGEELYLILIEDTSIPPEDDIGCALMVNRRHLSVQRELIFRRDFTTLEEAQDFCAKEYGVHIADWRDRITLPYTFQFDYKVSNTGVPQPYPVGFAGSTILFRLSEREDLETGERRPVLNICGNREGLRRLAAMCLLCADSAVYDEWFHVHLEDEEGFDGNIEATIRAASYLKSVSSGEFQEATGRISLPPDDTKESPSDKK